MRRADKLNRNIPKGNSWTREKRVMYKGKKIPVQPSNEEYAKELGIDGYNSEEYKAYHDSNFDEKSQLEG